MKKILIAVAGLAALGVSSASAADLAARPYTKAPPMVAPVLTWNGFYLGVQGGGGWGRSDETFIGAPNAPGFIGSQNYDTSGGFAGGVVGYNWQFGNTVFGLEGDYHWSDINGRSAEINAGLLDTYNTKLRSFGDIKGRLGYAAGPALWFVSGGAAVGDIQHRYDAALNGGAANSSVTSDTRWGWTVGAGVEYMFAQNWSGKIEYNYIDLGTSTLQYSPVVTNRSEWKDTFHTLKVGINYHFNWTGPVVAKY
ncbi:porin family protein [Bradyrhizobium tropiciagri]|uniref:outer membrane protein n=1 Tax=Bradyrhizobium tropiciagri TaxID=312253 RepID=UPI001BAB11C1|nr:outer membrane beta-barrel protein [Bradyrhizobium tropiciagri]MBR0872632.1 porin family protein [Bradyrhizobium tropiciagri]